MNKLRITYTVALYCSIIGVSNAASVLFDLNGSYTVPGGTWNTVSSFGTGVHVVNAVDSAGNATSVAFNCVDDFIAASTGGDPGVTAYPYEAGVDSFYVSYLNPTAKILIGGLTPGQSYDFKFFGSRASSGPRMVDVTIGSVTVTYDATYNTSNVAVINNVIAGGSGVVAIEAKVSAVSGNNYGYLGVIEVVGTFAAAEPAEPGIFVAPDGDDSYPGTKSFPLATLTGARDKIRQMRGGGINDAAEMTLSAWIYPDVNSGYIGVLSSSGDYFALNIVETGAGYKIDFRANGAALYSADNICHNGQWSHLAGVWKSGQMHKLYLNGVEVASNSSPATGAVNSDTWYLASDRLIDNRYFNGQIKGAYVWDRALSVSEIAELTGTQPASVEAEAVYSHAELTDFSGDNDYALLEPDIGPLPDGGVTVYFREGRYYFNNTTTLSLLDSGTADNPIIYKAYQDEEVIFDGSVVIDSSGFSIVSDQLVLDRMGNGAAGNVYGCYISDSSLRSQLSKVLAVLDLDGRMAQVSRYPNVGNCHIASVLDEGAIYTQGRTPGDPPTYDMDNPIGAEFTLVETNAARWETEFATVKKAQLTGYLDNDWYKETHRIADVNLGVIKLLEYSRYGVSSTGARRLYVLNFLCELDSPGEFYFDESANMLYVWPYEPITAESNVGVWNGPEFLKLYCSYVNFEDLVIQGTTLASASGTGMITFYSGDNVKFSGCTFRNTSRPAVSFMGDCTSTNSGIIGCDLYDAAMHLGLYGGIANATEITPAGNYAINCHFTQVQSRDYSGRIYARGVGNIFRNNLIHNLPDNPILNGGNDNIIELNEVFNCGFESGDGGAMGWGAAMWSYGNVFKHNFLHHLMCTPGFHARGGMYPDQLDAGDTFEENVFYKAAHRAILLNGGAGHSVLRNVFLNGYIGIYQTEAYAQSSYDDIPLYDNGTLTRGDVGDYIWRTEQVVGTNGWNNEPWLSHYPMFALIMNQSMMRFWPIESYFIGNLFYGNIESNFQYRYSSSSFTTDIDSTPSYIHKSDNQDISIELFEDPDSLNFKFNEPRPSYAPDIPFGNVGLYIGDGRKRMPDKKLYRRIVKDHFKGRASYDPSIAYDPATINGLMYWNSGQIMMNLENAGDFDGDSKVNLSDFPYLAKCWQESAPPLTPADATGTYAYWPLDNGSGSIATDSSGNGYNGTISGAVWTDGRFNKALLFDGINDKVAIPALNLNSNTITITAWIKRYGTQINATPIFYTRSSSTPDAGVILTADGRLWGRWNGSWETTLQTPDGQWVFIAYVVEPTKQTMYLHDGTLQSQSNSGTFVAEEFDGISYLSWDQNYPTTRYLKGMLDDVRVYNTALTESELGQMLEQHEEWPCDAADFSRDGTVNLDDLSVFISHWLSQ